MCNFHFNSISSTNDYAKNLLEQHSRVVVTADFQTAGRGRNQKTWEGNYGDNLYLSYGINHIPHVDFIKAASHQAIGSLAVLASLEKITSRYIYKIKYPNDIYAFDLTGYKKISGILTEHGFMGHKCIYSIIGLGVNINQVKFSDDIVPNVTSFKLLNLTVDINKLTDLIISELDFYEKMDFSTLFNLWKIKLNIVGKNVKIINKTGVWVIKEVLDDSRLQAINNHSQESIIIDNGDSIKYDLG